jgi:oligopeptide/dipeptide ABC transporter ATP-binding protein
MTDRAEPLLEIDGLVVEVGGGARAVDGVSLEVKAGRMLALVGESGSGKSLTALACVGLLPGGARVAAGRVRYRGRDLLGLPASALRAVRGREIGFVFQEPMTALHPTMRAGDQVAEAILVHERVSPREARARAVALLERVGIPEPARRAFSYPHALSGGQRQRVAIAIALAASPSVLLADEPTTALDPTLRREVMDLLASLMRERALGVLFVSHDLGLVADHAAEVAVLYAGRVVERGPSPAIFERPLHPYTRGLMRALPRLDLVRPRLEAIPGAVPSPGDRPGGCRFRSRCPDAQARCAEREPALDAREGGRGVACWLA